MYGSYIKIVNSTITQQAISANAELANTSTWPIYIEKRLNYEIRFPKGAKLYPIPRASNPMIDLRDIIILPTTSLVGLDTKRLKIEYINFYLSIHVVGIRDDPREIISAKDWVNKSSDSERIIPNFPPLDFGGPSEEYRIEFIKRSIEKEIRINNYLVYSVEQPYPFYMVGYKDKDIIEMLKNYYYKFLVFKGEKSVYGLVFPALSSNLLSSNEPLVPYVKKYLAIIDEMVNSFRILEK